MVPRYLSIESVIQESQERLFKEKPKWLGGGPADPLKLKKKSLMESFISIFEYIENATARLGRKDESTFNNVDVFVSGIFSNVDRFIINDNDLSEDVSKMCMVLKTNILHL